MANYVWNRVLCPEDFFENFFLAFELAKNGEKLPVVTLCRLSGELKQEQDVSVYRGDGFGVQMLADGRVEAKFCTRWEYPIAAIRKAFSLCGEGLEWYA